MFHDYDTDECPAVFAPCRRSPEGTCYHCGDNIRWSFAHGGSRQEVFE
jgi:hypothetical protein